MMYVMYLGHSTLNKLSFRRMECVVLFAIICGNSNFTRQSHGKLQLTKTKEKLNFRKKII